VATWVDSKFVGGVSELTLLTPIKRGKVVYTGDDGKQIREERTYEERLNEHLKSVQKRIDDGIVTSVSRIATIHFARWQILLPAHYLAYDTDKVDDRPPTPLDALLGLPKQKNFDLYRPWLLFTSNFDGDLKTYLNEFSALIANDVDRIWGNCEGYPEEGCINFDAYWAYAKKHQITTQAFFNAYPGLGVARIRELALFRERFDALVARTRAPNGSSSPQLLAEFDKFLSDNLSYPQNFPAIGGLFNAK
jgi:hypothetical protein